MVRAEATLAIPSLGIDVPIELGSQAVIDAGVAAHYEAPGWLPPTAAGAPGTFWLAAHHVTHGGPFLRLPAIHVGAAVVITTPTGQRYVYVVTSLQIVGTTASYATVYGTKPSARLILLQTCFGAANRLFVHGVLTQTR